jgi:hypothetical protein
MPPDNATQEQLLSWLHGYLNDAMLDLLLTKAPDSPISQEASFMALCAHLMPNGVKLAGVSRRSDGFMATVEIDTKTCSPDALEYFLGVRELPPITYCIHIHNSNRIGIL